MEWLEIIKYYLKKYSLYLETSNSSYWKYEGLKLFSN